MANSINSSRHAADVARSAVLALFIGLWIASTAAAQDTRESGDGPLPDYARRIEMPAGLRVGPVDNLQLSNNGLPHILLTGYWPPTNEMVRQFSQSAVQNPGGWVGENWENRGYNIYSFFPEFPNGLNKGEGDFEVDYQDTSADWWPLLETMKPIALITFSRAANNRDWELEGGNRTYATNSWSPDYLAPTRPGPGLPIIDIEPPLTERFSTLPKPAIINAVLADPALDALNPYATVIDNGAFLSNYIGYHGNWWHDLHSSPADPAYNVGGGHIHVGYAMTLAEAVRATEVTLRAYTPHIDSIILNPRGDMNCDGSVNGADIAPFTLSLVNRPAYTAAYPTCFLRRADVNLDAAVSIEDVEPFVQLLLSE